MQPIHKDMQHNHMGQHSIWVPDELEKVIRQKAKEANLSVARFLADLVTRKLTVNNWPDGYFEHVFGQWAGGPLERESQGLPEQREELE